MKDDEEFKKALADKQVPILVLDEKWHRLFAVHGKPDEIHETENELNALLARQGKLNEELKQLKKVKKQLMESIVANMDGTTSEDMDAQPPFFFCNAFILSIFISISICALYCAFRIF